MQLDWEVKNNYYENSNKWIVLKQNNYHTIRKSR